MAAGFSSEKVTVVIEDGYKFLADHKNSFDITICDLSDPDGSALNSDECANPIELSF